MENLFIYLLKSGIWIAVFWLIYNLFLKKEKFFVFNRLFLLAGLILPFLFAFCQYRYAVNIDYAMQISNPQTVNMTMAVNDQTFSVAGICTIAAWIYGIGAVLLLLHNIVSISQIIRLMKSGGSGFHSSFSFFGHIFLDNRMELQTIEKELIIEHESAHVREMHWIDILVAQIICVVQWFNPFAWLIFRAIKENHEFLADNSVIVKGYSKGIYQAVMINNVFKAPVFALTNSFASYNKLKRITMMKKNVSNPLRKWAVLLLVPVMAAFLWAFAKPEYRFTLSATSPETTVAVAVRDSVKVEISKSDGEKKIKRIVIKKKKIVDESDVTEAAEETKLIVEPKKDGKPLIIIDDQIVDIKLDSIDESKIESITILKDKSAKKIYGEKGKDGVVIIATKKVSIPE